LRFLEIAEKINKQTIVITDTDWSLDAIQEKYSDYLGANKKDNIEISYDATLDSGELLVSGKPFNYNTLEPKVLKANSLELLNNIFDKKFETEDEMHKFMKKNKTNCALLLFETNVNFVIPSYINDML
jgi:putative ATP-dependent endonuclease of the OLD family